MRGLVGVQLISAVPPLVEELPGRRELLMRRTEGVKSAHATGLLAQLVQLGRWNGTVVMTMPSYAMSDVRRRAAIRL